MNVSWCNEEDGEGVSEVNVEKCKNTLCRSQVPDFSRLHHVSESKKIKVVVTERHSSMCTSYIGVCVVFVPYKEMISLSEVFS